MAGNHNSGRKGAAQEGRKNTEIMSGVEVKDLIRNIVSCRKVIGYDTMNDRARQLYHDFCIKQIRSEVLREAHLPLILIYATQMDVYLSAAADIVANGTYFLKTDKSGRTIGTIENPSVKLCTKSADVIKGIISKFGNTPADFEKVKELHPKERALSVFDTLSLSINSGGD